MKNRLNPRRWLFRLIFTPCCRCRTHIDVEFFHLISIDGQNRYALRCKWCGWRTPSIPSRILTWCYWNLAFSAAAGHDPYGATFQDLKELIERERR